TERGPANAALVGDDDGRRSPLVAGGGFPSRRLLRRWPAAGPNWPRARDRRLGHRTRSRTAPIQGLRGRSDWSRIFARRSPTHFWLGRLNLARLGRGNARIRAGEQA